MTARVWITRTAPGADTTAARVADAGFIPVVAPLLVPKPVRATPPSSDDAVAFTSPNGVRVYNGPRSIPAWCVGAATARAARAAGFADVRVGGGDVAHLAARMATELDRPLVHWAGAHVRGDLVGVLKEAGHAARRVVAYRAHAVDACPLDLRVDAVLLHSPRAAEVFAGLCAGRSSVAVSLSSAVDAALGPQASHPSLARFVSDAPSDAALVETLRSALAQVGNHA